MITDIETAYSLERTRASWEELERIEQAIAERIRYSPHWLPESHAVASASTLNSRKKRPRRHVLTQQLDVSRLMARYARVAEALRKHYLSHAPLATVAAPDGSLTAFYDAVSQVKTLPDTPTTSIQDVYQRKQRSRGLKRLLSDFTSDVDIDRLFSPPEQSGVFFDLSSAHEALVNIPSAPKVSYQQYLDVFADFDDVIYIPIRSEGRFRSYLVQLRDYLFSFYNRTHLLTPTAEELVSEAVGLRAKEGIYCEACQKDFASEGVYSGHLSGRKHQRAVQRKNGDTAESHDSGGKNNLLSISHLEEQIRWICRLLAGPVEATKSNLTRKLGLTEHERLLEASILENQLSKEKDEMTASESDEGASETKGPKPSNLPIGQDGNPIPRWLWKLNGLCFEFDCQICGGHTYSGRKAFYRHFTEARHTHGLQCLGIQPSSAFNGISSINEAIELNHRLAVTKRRQQTNDVEMEDEQGNVMTKRVYDDLKKQGVI